MSSIRAALSDWLVRTSGSPVRQVLVLAVDATITVGCFWFAMLLIRTGRLNDAVRCFERVVKLAPDDPGARSNLGLAYAKQAEPEKAMRELDVALRLAPNHTSAHLNKGILLQTQGKTAEAIQEFRAVLAIAPDHAEARRRLRELESR